MVSFRDRANRHSRRLKRENEIYEVGGCGLGFEGCGRETGKSGRMRMPEERGGGREGEGVAGERYQHTL